MPIVPGTDVSFVPTEKPQGQGIYNTIDRATPENFGGQVGQTLSQAGDILAQHALQRQQLINESTVNDTYANQFMPAFRDLYAKFYNLQGKDAEAQYPAYQEQMNNLRGQVRTDLPNAMQQKMFDELSMRRMSFELDGMARHAAQQTQVYHKETSDSLLGEFVNDGIDKYTDPRTLRNRENSIAVEAGAFGQQSGQPPEQANLRAQHYIDQMYKGAIERQLQANPTAGIAMYDQYKSKLSGPMQAELERAIKPVVELGQAQSAYGKITGGMTAQAIASEAQRQGVDPNTALTIWSAEGGVTNPVTKNPTSSATGIFQHIDSTWAAQGGTDQDRFDAGRQIQLGVTLAKENQQALAKDLGRQPQPWEIYLAHQQGIGGATALLHADPNSSAAAALGGNAKKLTLNGIPADATASEALQSIKGYVDRHALMYDPSGAPSAQNIRENYIFHIDQLRQQAQQDNPGDPSLADKYISHYEQQAGIALKADQMVDRANLDQVSAGITGPQGAKSWQEAMKNPQWAQAYADASKRDPSVYDRVDKAIRINAFSAWDPAPTADSNALHDELKGSQYTDRTRFENLNLPSYYGAMPISDLNDLMKDQTQIRKEDQAQAQKHVSLEHAQKLMEPILEEANSTTLHPNTPWQNVRKTSMGAQAQKYNQFVAQLDTGISNWRQNNGEKIPDDGTIIQIGRGILFPGESAKAPQQEQPGSFAKPGGNFTKNIPNPSGSSENTGTSATQRQIDFSKFRPENQDDYSKWVVSQLQANGKLVNDDTITKAKALIEAQHPGTAFPYLQPGSLPWK